MGPTGFRALLIGNGTFEADPKSLKPLAGPKNDVRLLKDALTHPEVGLHASGDVQTLVDADHGEILQAIETFFEGATKDQQSLLYFTGHGRVDIKNRLYLCARNTQTNLLKSTAVQSDVVRGMMDDCAAAAVVVMLDCCYSGAFKGGGETALERFGGKGRFVLTSSRFDELSADAPEIDGYSAFTRFLGEALLSGEVDGNADGKVSVNEIYDYVLPRLRAATGQIPQRHLDKAYGDPYLGRAFRRAGAVAPPVHPGRPRLAVSEKEIKLDGVKFDETLRDEVVDVFNTGDGELDWTAECVDDWVELVLARGHFVIKMRPRPGLNRAAIRVRDRNGGGSETVRLLVEVAAAPVKPRLEVYPERLDFGTLTLGAAGWSSNKTIELHNAGGGELSPSAKSSAPWLSARVKGDAVVVSLVNAPTGRLAGSIQIASAGGDASIPVTAVIEPGPTLVASPSSLDFGDVTEGVLASKRIEVRNSGSGTLEWSFRDAPDFVEVTRSGSGLNVKLTSKVGTHVGSIRLEGNGGEQTIQVRAVVAPVPAPKPRPVPPAPAPAPVTAKAAPAPAMPESSTVSGMLENVRNAMMVGRTPSHVDIAGTWQGAQGGLFQFLGTGPQYQVVDLNAMGVQVGQGVARVEGNRVHIEAFNTFMGAWTVDLQVTGVLMTGQVLIGGQFATLLLQRVSLSV